MRAKFAKFFVCINGHTEDDRGEPDHWPLPFRPCKICRLPLKRTSIRLDKSGRFAPDVAPTEPQPQQPKRYTPRGLVNRIIKRLSQADVPECSRYVKIGQVRTDKMTGSVIFRMTRANEEPLIIDNKCYPIRTIEFLIDGPNGIHVSFMGVKGWIEDVRAAVKRIPNAYIASIHFKDLSPTPVTKGGQHGRQTNARGISKLK